MTAAEIQDIYRRVVAVRREDHEPDDHYYACVIVADLAALPFGLVWAACLDVEE